MGNAQSGGGVWPVKHGSTKAFRAMADKDADVATATFGAGACRLQGLGFAGYRVQGLRLTVHKPGGKVFGLGSTVEAGTPRLVRGEVKIPLSRRICVSCHLRVSAPFVLLFVAVARCGAPLSASG
jgi:hypothetical protein